MTTELQDFAKSGPQHEEQNDFYQLLQKEFRPKTDEARSAVEQAVHTLAKQVLSDTNLISDDAFKSIEAIIGQLDRKLSEQLNLIIHHADFQQLESAWRGLHYLITNTETDEMLKVKVFNVAKTDLHRTLRRFKGTNWDQSPFFKRVYEEEYGQFGGEPFGCMVGDYFFDHSPVDVELLREISRTAAASHCPFITGAAPSVMQMESWQELANPRDLTKIFQTPEYAAWRSLRESEDARYLGLAMPRFLARLPYGVNTNPVDEFDFEEDTAGAAHERFGWANSAYAMAVNINRSFKQYGWCTRIRGVESGGAVENLPCHTFPTDDGGVDLKCPTEIAISDRREAELAQERLHAAAASQELGSGRLYRRTVAAKADRVHGRRCQRQRPAGCPPALPVCRLPLCPLPQVHRARQDRFVHQPRRNAALAQRMDTALRRWRSFQLVRIGQG